MTTQRIALGIVFLLALGGLVLNVGGCPGPTPNQNPVANAGPDQTVQVGTAVALNGAGSSDPDGDPLTFAWAQTAGTAVTLTGANTATPSFTAPATAGTLTFQLTVNDGQGGTASDAVNVVVQLTPPGNRNPIANAGPDQNVLVGAAVALNGAGSSDPDGDPLTFAWTQTAGTAVTLAGAATATPSFTAPTTAGTLTFQLTVNDGRGGSNSDTVNVVVRHPPRLFVASFAGNNVVSFHNPATLTGNIAPNTNLAGAQTQLSLPTDIVVTANDTLLVSNFATNALTGYLNASTANGNLAPDRNVQGANTLLAGPVSLAIHRVNDLVFVAMAAGASIRVYADGSTAAFNGNLGPIRTITSANINTARGINLDGGDNLYVANNGGGGSIAVFANASTRNGVIPADRVITSAAFANVFDVFVDQADRMYVVNSLGSNRILVFNNAATLSGARMPDSVLVIPAAAQLSAIAVDTNGIGYVVDATANAVYAYDNIATRNGTFAPDRTIQGANTQLVTPIRVFLVE